MNLYFLVEGRVTEKKVYERWALSLFPQLTLVSRPEDVGRNSIRLIAARGFPNYLARISETLAEIRDVVAAPVDRLFVCIDAEEWSFAERYDSVTEHLQAHSPTVPFTVIVQDPCIEAWLLGNRAYVKRDPPRDSELRAWLEFYDVRSEDPELLPLNRRFATRAQCHKAYLRAAHQQRRGGSASLLGRVSERSYFDQLVRRQSETDHISSFGRLVRSWRDLGAGI